MNKIVIGILALLLIVCGSFGYYAYTLSGQIDYLSSQLASYHQEQVAGMKSINAELVAFKGETRAKTSELESNLVTQIDTVRSTFQSELNLTRNNIDTLERDWNDTANRVSTLKDDINNLTGLSQSVINAHEVYQKVRQATVRISNGEGNLGSGFILDNEAHVVTAFHVVENVSQIYVILPNGRVAQASTVGTCQYSDIAVLKLDRNPAIEPPPLADSNRIKIGEPVVSIGHPFDLTDSLTAGIVSQLNRFVEIQRKTGSQWVANLVQFDAAANFGNSGCPLINSGGEIIGLVIARVDPDEGDGIYYAVSSNKVNRVTAGIIAEGSYDYPRIGITITNLTPQLARDIGLESINGVRVVDVAADSPAATVGINKDDIILRIDGTPIRDVAALTSYIGEYKSSGEQTRLSLMRGETSLERSFTMGSMPE